MSVIELPQGYYLTNFKDLINYVYSQYEDLLNEKELDFYHSFSQISENSQKLYVRMLTRKGNYFRCQKLQYSEIQDTELAAEELNNHQLIAINEIQPIENLLPLFNKQEWLKILSQLELDNSTINNLKKLKRVDLDTVLIEIGQEFDICTLFDDKIFELVNPDLFDSFKLLFFGNLNQDLTEFVLRDLGLYQFENYHIDKTIRLFVDRNQIDSYLNYYKLLENLEEVLSGNKEDIINFHRQLSRLDIQDKTLARRIQRVTITLARQLERIDALNEAISLYQICELPPARERISRILVKQSKVSEALAICESIMDSPMDESESIFASDFGYRTAKKHRVEWPKPVNYQPKTEIISVEQSEDGVELDASEHFNQFGQCLFVENGLFSSLFGLHYWEMIFAPVQGAFTNPFQVRPHDLYEKEFISSRQSLYDNLTKQLNDIPKNRTTYLQRIREKFGTASPFVYWDLFDEHLLNLALDRIPTHHWQLIFKRLWQDIRANRSGFPDLILFPNTGGYELIEIKGPGDRLQKNQIRWMQYFAKFEIPHKVVHVEWR